MIDKADAGVMDNGALSDWLEGAASITLTVKLTLAADVGVPLRIPLADRLNHDGDEPTKDHP